MKAVGLTRYLPIDDENSLFDFETARPEPKGRDILVKIKSISVNPIDVKLRAAIRGEEKQPKILGFDASGIVEQIGEDVSLFNIGDEVYYAGNIERAGSNAQYQIVDERIVGFKPKSFSFEEAAALPLTAITAYESLFERLQIDKNGADGDKNILIIGGAGGVGSIAIQLAKLAGLNVIASASRKETIKWVKYMGADKIVNHMRKMKPQIAEIGHEFVDYIALFNNSDAHWEDVVNMIKPQGKIVLIVANQKPLDMSKIRIKSAIMAWEFMFTRPLFATKDMIKQHYLLNEISKLADEKKIKSTLTTILEPFCAKTLRKAHLIIESGKAKGKIVISGFN